MPVNNMQPVSPKQNMDNSTEFAIRQKISLYKWVSIFLILFLIIIPFASLGNKHHYNISEWYLLLFGYPQEFAVEFVGGILLNPLAWLMYICFWRSSMNKKLLKMMQVETLTLKDKQSG